MTPPDSASSSVRVDKWLWAARCFKTRSQATEACAAGAVQVNGRAAKASQSVKAGDIVDVRCPAGERTLKVTDLAERRGSAAVAQALFEDLTPPPPEKPSAEEEGAQLGWDPGGRPDKRDRQTLRRLRDRW